MPRGACRRLDLEPEKLANWCPKSGQNIRKRNLINPEALWGVLGMPRGGLSEAGFKARKIGKRVPEKLRKHL